MAIKHSLGAKKRRWSEYALTSLAVLMALSLSCNAGAAEHPQRIVVTHSAPNQLALQHTLDSIHDEIIFQHDYGTYTWLELNSAAQQLMSDAGIPYTRIDQRQISFLDWHFDPLDNAYRSILNQTPVRDASGFGLGLIQLRAPVTQEWLDQLRGQGLRLLQYYPHHSYLVWSDQAALSRARTLPQVRWAGDFVASFRTSPELKRFSGDINNLHIHFYNSGDPQTVIRQITRQGAVLLNEFPAQPDRQLYEAIFQAPSDILSQLSQIPEVIWMGYASPEPELEDESGAQTIAGNLLPSGQPEANYPGWLSEVGLDGSGVVWSITDTGIDYSHADINSRIIGGFSYPGCTQPQPGNDPNTGGHGTHVAGILGGDGDGGFTDSNGYLYGLGVAPGVSLYAQNPICGTHNSWPPVGGWQELTKNPILAGAVGSNNSWTSGEGTAHGYQASERIHDVIVRDGNFDTMGVAEQFMVVFSAGNSGPGARTLTAPKEAKNAIVTGGVRTWRVSSDVGQMYNSSSRGPAVDGRILPTIVTPGQQVSSTRNDGASQCASAISGTNGLYSFCTGTSMASPHAAGSLALITEWWRNNHGGANPSPAMGKALLINTATDISGAAAIPNSDEGWGRVTLRNLFQSTTPFELVDQTQILNQSGDEWVLTVGVADPNQPLKVSLVWSDAPGAVGANPALVNDLNLVVNSAGQSYLGNVFSNGQSVAGGTADTLNNIENVFLSNPGGSAEIRVSAFNIAGDGVPYNADTSDQDFALVCSNCVLQPDYVLNLPQSQIGVCAPDDAEYNIAVDAILGFNEPVTLALTSNPAGTSASFSPNPVIPANNSLLTLTGTGSVATGSYTMQVQASAGGNNKTTEIGLAVYDEAPGQASLISPADQAADQSLQLSLSWSASSQSGSYLLEIDDDPNFLSVDYSANVSETSHTLTSALNSSARYYWRVTNLNACGSTVSQVFSFTTSALPGDCNIGLSPSYHFLDDLDSGAPGWTHDGQQDSWNLSGDIVWNGTAAWHAVDPDASSDQRLMSPAISLPSDELPLTLQFYHRQSIERQNATSCWDAGILEISTDGGTQWTQVEENLLLTDPYNGTIGNGNPLSGQRGWCGDPQDWTRSVVDLSSWQGQIVQFRFRLASDTSVGRPEGWRIDDVRVQSCPSSPILLQDGFESP